MVAIGSYAIADTLDRHLTKFEHCLGGEKEKPRPGMGQYRQSEAPTVMAESSQ